MSLFRINSGFHSTSLSRDSSGFHSASLSRVIPVFQVLSFIDLVFIFFCFYSFDFYLWLDYMTNTTGVLQEAETAHSSLAPVYILDYMIKTTGVLQEAETAHPSLASVCIPMFWRGSVFLIVLVFCIVFCLFVCLVPSVASVSGLSILEVFCALIYISKLLFLMP